MAERVPLNIAVVEDTFSDTEVLIELIRESDTPFTFDCFESGEAFMQEFSEGYYDLIFLDVFMYDLNGVETAERIRDLDTQVVIVFTTTSEDYTRESYRLNAYKYLLKPLSAEDVADALDLAVLKRDKAQGANLTIVSENEPVTILFADILYVESSNRRSLVVTKNGTYSTLMTIDALQKLLPAPRFLRSHRSYIVNFDFVDELADDFIMNNGDIVYITVKNYRKVKRAYEDYLFTQVRSGDMS
jgi:DNA-binding LytR/AlgR family response regulator